MDVSNASKWHEMSVRLEKLLNPSVYNTSKYINLSGVEMRSVRQFRTLDGAAALESPQRDFSGAPKAHVSSPLVVRNGAGAGAGATAGSGSRGTMSTDVGSPPGSGNHLRDASAGGVVLEGGGLTHARTDSIEDVELGVVSPAALPHKSSRVVPAPLVSGHGGSSGGVEFRKESPVAADNAGSAGGSRRGWSQSRGSVGGDETDSRYRVTAATGAGTVNGTAADTGTRHGPPARAVVSVPGQLGLEL